MSETEEETQEVAPPDVEEIEEVEGETIAQRITNRRRHPIPNEYQESESNSDNMQTAAEETNKIKQKSVKKRGRKQLGDKQMDLELEREKLEFEKLRLQERMEMQKLEYNERMHVRDLEHQERLKQIELEMEKVKSKPPTPSETSGIQGTNVKLKLQPYDFRREDILTYLNEFEIVAEKMKWGEEMKVLQLRSLLTGDAREVARVTSNTFLDLKQALVSRFSKKPHEYFGMLIGIHKGENETYRGFKSRIDLYLQRFIDGRNPVSVFADEFFLQNLPSDQSQWVRRNRGTSTCVEAAEDYIAPEVNSHDQMLSKSTGNGNKGSPNAKVDNLSRRW